MSGWRHEELSCSNCDKSADYLWRSISEGEPVCYECHVHYNLLGVKRQVRKPRKPLRLRSCSNCGTSATPQWRRNNKGESVCYACHQKQKRLSLLPGASESLMKLWNQVLEGFEVPEKSRHLPVLVMDKILQYLENEDLEMLIKIDQSGLPNSKFPYVN